MAYIGNVPAEKYSALTQQTFSSPTGTSFTLDQSCTNSRDIALFIDNVRQNPASYSVSGTALTTSTISSPSTMYCLFNGKTTETVNPPDDSVGLSQMASGTDGNLITFDASGNPAYVATGNDGQVLTSAGAGQPCLFEDASGGAWAVLSSGTATTTSTLDITGITKTTRIIYSSISAATNNTNLVIRTSTDGGSSFDTGGSDYRYSFFKHEYSQSSFQYESANNSVIPGADSIGNVAADCSTLSMTLYDPSNTTQFKQMWLEEMFLAATSAPEIKVGMATRESTANIDAVRLYVASGTTFSCVYTVLELN